MLHPSQSSATRWALWRRNLSFAATAIGIFKQLLEGLAAGHKLAQDRPL
jgi:hypothetical protein